MKALGPGARIADRYVLESVIARGGMGAVYKAIDERLGRTVAIKVLLTELAEDKTSIARFEREATVSARLTHPAIVQMFDFGKHDGIAYIVMELVVGRTLAQELEDKRRIEPERACEIIEQALGGINAAHEAGIVHRDLKPGNIMLIPTGTGREAVKVLDFGIAQLKDSAPYARLTKSGAVLGTPTFMSPEQARGETCDPRTDVYAMGVVLWCCLTGQKPFQGPDVPTILGKVLNEMPPRADKVNPAVPPAIAHATERAMEKRPTARHPTAAAFAQALMDAVEASAIPATAAVALPTESRASGSEQTGPIATARPSGGGPAAASASGDFALPRSSGAEPATREVAVAMASTPTPPPPAAVSTPAPATSGLPRWLLPLVAIAVLVGVGLGVLAVLGVFEYERDGVDLGALGGPPVVAPAVPTAPVTARGGAPSTQGVPPVANAGAALAPVCQSALRCCEAIRRTLDPQVLSCEGAVANADGDATVCASLLVAYQGRFGEAGLQLPPDCTQ